MIEVRRIQDSWIELSWIREDTIRIDTSESMQYGKGWSIFIDVRDGVSRESDYDAVEKVSFESGTLESAVRKHLFWIVSYDEDSWGVSWFENMLVARHPSQIVFDEEPCLTVSFSKKCGLDS